MKVFLGKCFLLLFASVLTESAASAPLPTSTSICRRDDFNNLVFDLNLQCPFVFPFASSAVQVDGELLQTAVSFNRKNEYIAILFYASWCPFSSIFVSRFSALSFLYPQIKHLMVEQSSAMPSVFSIYGVHSVPTLLIVNHSTKSRYHGQKDMQSLVDFYKRNTGLDPITHMADEASAISETKQKVQQGAHLILGDPYLVLSVAFITLKALLYFFPESTSCLLALWAAYIPHLNLGIFGESRQILGHLLHLLDVKRMWRKLKLYKTRNFHEGARNARVWASSLSSVSVGEASARVFSSRGL